MNVPTSLTVPTVKIRYFAFNCTEIQMPGGKTLLVDPCLHKDGPFGCGYDVSDLEGCDYVFINHAHGDHASSLGEVYDRFHPLVMAHASTTFELAKYYDVPYIRFLPFTTGDTFDFDDFSIQVVHGRHNNITPGNFNVRPSGRLDELCPPQVREYPYRDELEKTLWDKGTMFGSNFLMTLSNNLKIGFYAGNAGMEDPQDRNVWKQLRPDIIFAHRAKFVFADASAKAPYDYAEKMADILEITGARVLLPIHIEDAYAGKYDPAEYVAKVNDICQRRGLAGRMMFLERGQWYQFSTGVAKI